MSILYETQDLGIAAVLKASGLRYVGARPGSLVTLQFDDADGKARELADRHVNGGININSALMDAELNWVRNQVFACKKAGRDNAWVQPEPPRVTAPPADRRLAV